ncbi:MAG: condensation domain-containing protein [Acidobacteriota bacterium]|nr:condensation domain-containing protein [Acidobacteriota bacterium]
MSGGPRVEALHPLTPSQTGMWLQSASGGHDRFVEQAAFCLEGRVDREALVRALQCVVDRHGALRSSILAKGLQPVRAVLQEMRVNLREVDAEDDENAALDALMDDERRRGFPLNRPPLIRFALLKVRDERAWLVLSFHHIILDGWSLLILWTEAAAFYAAAVAGARVQLPPVAEERAVSDWLRRRSDADSERYWRARLAGFTRTPLTAAVEATSSMGLPVGLVEATPSSCPPKREARRWMGLPVQEPGEVEHVMSPDAGAAIAVAAQACRVSPAIVFDGLWALVLAGRTRRNDVAFAATVSGRPPEIPGIDRMVGCFINTVPVRVRFEDGETVRALLARHQQVRAEQAEFEYCSSGQIQGWSELRPGEPLCHSLLVYENLRGPGAEAAAEPAVSEAGRRVRGARTGYPITLLVSPGATPHLRAIYQPGSISAADVRELMGELEDMALRLQAGLDAPAAEWSATVRFVPPFEPPAAATARPPFIAPRTRLEHELAAIWEGLFKTSPIGVLDDFYSLGGHSLLVLQMAAQLRAVSGAELPLHVLVSATTIETLAQACSSLRQGDGSAGVDDHAALIPLSTEGAGREVFCPHPLGGHVLCYAALGRRLAGRHRAFGLQAKGLAPSDAPAASWDELIAHHWSLLLEARHAESPAEAGRHIKRPGPHPLDGAPGANVASAFLTTVALAKVVRRTVHPLDGVGFVGYSYGGYIAMELAVRAYREGATDVRVVLLDVPHPTVVPSEQRRPDAATLLHALFGHGLGLALEDMQRVPGALLTRHVYDEAVARHVIPRETPFEQVERVLNVAEAHSRLEPPVTPYPFSVLLVRAREGADRISDQPDFGWTPFVGGLATEWVAGSHETMLDPKFAEELAALVANYLT